MLGDKFFIYPVFRNFFPFFYMIRNMHTFGPFLIFCLGCFVCMGSDFIFGNISPYQTKQNINKQLSYERTIKIIIILIMVSGCVAIFYFPIYIINYIPSILPPATVSHIKTIFFKISMHSSFNIIFFVIASFLILFLLKRPRINKRFKYLSVIFFILADLLFVNKAFFRLVTERISEEDFSSIPKFSTIPQYNDFRESEIKLQKGRFACEPLIWKKYVAYFNYTYYGSHFFETKDYHKLMMSEIPIESRDILMGISAPKLRLVKNAVILPRSSLIKALQKSRPETVLKAIFLEEDLPSSYGHLKVSLDDIDKQRKVDLGDIRVLYFNPNELLLDVHSNQDCLLYYSDGYDRSWRVFIDDEEARVYKANIAFKSTIVNKGKHRIRFLYDPKFYKISLLFYFIGLIISIIILLRFMIRFKLDRKFGEK